MVLGMEGSHRRRRATDLGTVAGHRGSGGYGGMKTEEDSGESYSPLIAGAIWRSAQSGVGLGRPVSEARGSSFVFFLQVSLFFWFFFSFRLCWFYPPVLLFPIGFFLKFSF